MLFEVIASDRQAALRFEQVLDRIDKQVLMEKILGKYDGVASSIRIPKLEIDIGNVENVAGDVLFDKLYNQLSMALEKAVADTHPKGKKTDRLSNLEAFESISEALIIYFTTGKKAWFLSETSTIASVFEKAVVQHPERLKKLLMVSVLHTDTAVFRLANLMNIQHIKILVEMLSHDSKTFLQTYRLVFPKFFNLSSKFLPQEVSATINFYLIQAAQQRHADTWLADKLIPLALQHIKTVTNAKQQLDVVQQYQKIIKSNKGKAALAMSVLWKPYLAAFQSVFGNKPLTTSKENKVDNAKSEVANKPKLLSKQVVEDATLIEEQFADETPKDNGLYLNHAGLVLLNPGLMMQYFKELNWVDGKAIKDEASANAMRLWMHYLVWGSEVKADESYLLLAKLLTGADPSQAVALYPLLNSEALDAANEYVKTIIETWKALKSTSIDGLRTGFLQRSGILQYQQSGWQLQVEQKTQDILLNYLPWSYSIIKFPWMPKPLFTQWNTSN